MRSTLFYIPHADPLFGIPLFGVGWLLGLLIVAMVITVVIRARQHGWNSETLGDLSLFIVLGIAIVGVAPMIEQRTAADTPIGIPIRGYGVMLLIGIVTSVLLLMHEARRMGIHPDTMLSLAFSMVVTGFLGARLFYVIEYWPRFAADSLVSTLGNILKLTDGGLVVYGSFIGALVAILAFVHLRKLPLLAIVDLLAPCLMLGVAFGRIGCFMNGCCWGGVCEEGLTGVTFPQGSPPFVDQIEDGTLLDVRLKRNSDESLTDADDTFTVLEVTAGGIGDQAGLKEGNTIQHLLFPDATAFNRLRHGESADQALLTLIMGDGKRIQFPFGDLPKRTRPVYPVQIFSAINAAVICFFLWSFYPFRRRDGQVAALLLTIYPATRFLLEMVRIDEESVLKLGFRLTISQTISLVLLAGAIAFWTFLMTRPQGSALPLVGDGKSGRLRAGG